MKISKEFKEVLDSVRNKRAKFVIDKILETGSCSTEDLKEAGYEHAPRAARDVRELGIPLETFKVKDRNGKSIAAYKFGDWEQAKKKNQLAKTGGRTQLAERLKIALLDRYGSRCHLYGEEYSPKLLQPDHRVPYEIGGNPEDMFNTDYFMLLSPSANREKSWTCEHCVNWIDKNIDVCGSCYYAFPESYQHIAGEQERRLNLIFKKSDIELYNALVQQAKIENTTCEHLTKRMMKYFEQVNKNNGRK